MARRYRGKTLVHNCRPTGFPALACAILRRAIGDARSNNSHAFDARVFLESAGCQTMCAYLGDTLDFGDIDEALTGLVSGLPEPRVRQLELNIYGL